MKINDFVLLDSVYGQFIVPRTCLFQAEALVKTGRTHIESELKNIFAILATLPNGSIVVDGGTNAGFFTIPVAHTTQDRNFRIIAFEPQRQLFQAVSGSLALNGYRHVYLHNVGLGQTTGTAQLPEIDYSVVQDFGTVQLSNNTTVQEQSWMNDRVVDVISIDEMNLPRLDFLKLDVEGYEVPALLGAHNTLKKFRPWIWAEYFLTGAQPIKQSLQYLDNYSFFLVDYQNMLCAPNEKLSLVRTENLQPV